LKGYGFLNALEGDALETQQLILFASDFAYVIGPVSVVDALFRIAQVAAKSCREVVQGVVIARRIR